MVCSMGYFPNIMQYNRETPLSSTREEGTQAREFTPFEQSIKRTEVSTGQRFGCFCLNCFSICLLRSFPEPLLSLALGSVGQGHTGLDRMIPHSGSSFSFVMISLTHRALPTCGLTSKCIGIYF